MNVIFMGTPDFAVPVLKGLADAKDHTVTAVITQPDKARGRSGKPVFTPVKQLAVSCGIPVYTPERVKDADFVEELRKIPCDVIVVAAFGQILPQEILDFPPYGCINVHASLLPRWRGAAPIQQAILAGDTVTGITTMQMNAGLDTGDILLTKEVAIDSDETGESLFEKLALYGSALLLETLKRAEKGELLPCPQNEEESTYAKMLTKDMGNIDWEMEAVQIERYVRGLNSWPSAYSGWRGKNLKIWKSSVRDEDTEKKPGTVVSVEKNSFTVQTGKGCLCVHEVQLEGKKRMDAGSFLRGIEMQVGDLLSSDRN